MNLLISSSKLGVERHGFCASRAVRALPTLLWWWCRSSSKEGRCSIQSQSPISHFVQVTSSDPVINISLVDGQALMSPRPYGHHGVEPSGGEEVGNPLSLGEYKFLASPVGELSSRAAR